MSQKLFILSCMKSEMSETKLSAAVATLCKAAPVKEYDALKADIILAELADISFFFCNFSTAKILFSLTFFLKSISLFTLISFSIETLTSILPRFSFKSESGSIRSGKAASML